MAGFVRPAQGLLLTATAGWVDAVGFVRLQGFYPSFMSGNTTRLGIALSDEQWNVVIIAAAVLALFFAGSVCGGIVATIEARWRLAAVLALEALLLLGALGAALGGREREALLLLPVAMGVQNAAVYELRPGATTFVTGTLFRAGYELARAVVGKPDAAWLPQLLTWISFALGAAAGALGGARWGLLALSVPLVVVVGSAMLIMSAPPEPEEAKS
jgi:uncharacterized membrane protein YoaK (UPF0700 family)